MGELSAQKWAILLIMYGSLVCVFSSVALLPPFYPQLAERKGATPIEFALVIGIAKLTMAISSPIIGNKIVKNIEPKFLYSFGLLMVGGGYILLSFIELSTTFFSSSFIAQVVIGFGTACITNVSAALATNFFPDAIGSVFSGIEVSIGIGYVIGPLLGGPLYEYGGFHLPFASFGCVVLIMALAATLVLPSLLQNSVQQNQISVLKVVRKPGISLFLFSLFCVCLSFGFFMVTCVIHLRPFQLTPIEVSFVFVLNSFMVCCSASFSGRLCDHKVPPQVVTLVGIVFIIISFLLYGPAPFIPIPYTLSDAVKANMFFGIGKGMQIVSTFSGVCQEAIRAGFPDTMAIHGILSGLWNCFFSLGCFFGYIGGGALLQWMGVEWGSMCILTMETLAFLFMIIFVCIRFRLDKYKEEEENSQILEVDDKGRATTNAFGFQPTDTKIHSYGALDPIPDPQANTPYY